MAILPRCGAVGKHPATSRGINKRRVKMENYLTKVGINKGIITLMKEQDGYILTPLLERFLVLENWRRFDKEVYEYDLSYLAQLIRDLAVEIIKLKNYSGETRVVKKVGEVDYRCRCVICKEPIRLGQWVQNNSHWGTYRHIDCIIQIAFLRGNDTDLARDFPREI